MNIDAMSPIFGPQTNRKPEAQDAGSGSFAEMLAASVEQQPTEEVSAGEDDMAFIRDNGFRAYAEEVEKRKMEELREQILQRMGLSEEDLEAMPAEQRAQIEDLISNEIQRRMQASEEMDEDKPTSMAASPDMARAIADPGHTGAAGAVMLALMENHDTMDMGEATGDTGKPTGSNLPGDQEESA